MGRIARAMLASGVLGGATACQPELDVTWDALGCTDIDFNDPPESELLVEIVNGDIVASRNAVFMPSDAIFEPEIAAKGKEIVIDEAWNGGGGEGSVETCFVPTVVLADPARGDWTVVWNVAGQSAAFGNEGISVDGVDGVDEASSAALLD